MEHPKVTAVLFCYWAFRAMPMIEALHIIDEHKHLITDDFVERMKRQYPREWAAFKVAERLGVLK